jgi:hypothetical protein
MNELGLGVSQEETAVLTRKPRAKKEAQAPEPDANGKIYPIKTGTSQNDFRSQPRYDIRIDRPESEKSKDLKVGVNGTTFQIWYNTKVTVPECVVKQLQNCIGHRLVQMPNPNGGPPIDEWQEMSMIAMSVIRGPY